MGAENRDLRPPTACKSPARALNAAMDLRLQLRARAGVLERIVFEPSGLLRVAGYTLFERAPVPLALSAGDEAPRSPLFVGRTHRLDLKGDLRTPDEFLGFEAEFAIFSLAAGTPLRLHFGDVVVWEGKFPGAEEPPYAHLLEASEPVGRDRIYGVEPPVAVVPPVIGALLRGARGPVLAVGCAPGALVRHLLSRGLEAQGLEMDGSAIRQALEDDIRPHVRLSEGGLPLPYADASFQLVTAIEILQRVPEPGRFVAELARLAREELLVTVPDLSALPRCSPRRMVVPWHLLEADQVNFFTPRSLEALLRPHFAHLEVLRLEPVDLDGVRFFTKVGIRARKR